MTVLDHSHEDGMQIYRLCIGPTVAEPRGSGQWEFPGRECNGTVSGSELRVHQGQPMRACDLGGRIHATYQWHPR